MKLISRFFVLIIFSFLSFMNSINAQDSLWKNTAWQDSIWNSRGCFADAKGQWFRNAKFGAFIHFGLYSQLGGYWQEKGPYKPAEQIIGLGDKKAVIPAEQYKTQVGGKFNPAEFNAKEWVELIKKAGQKYVIVTTKHHDGFCMFKTATTSYNVVESTPFARDIIKELADECRKQGLIFCPYFSIGDWCYADVHNAKYKTYKEYMFAQLRELLTNYGDIKMMWFDNYWYVDNQWENNESLAKELYAFIRSIKPNIIINDRCGSGAGSTDGDYTTPENQLQGSRQSRYFEVVMTNTKDDNWGWVKTADNYRTCSELISNLIDCTSKGGNFVLNVGPTATGKFPAQHLAIIDTLGKWTSANGEAIYGTNPTNECSFDSTNGAEYRTTRSSGHIYIHILKWPVEGKEVTIQIKQSGFKKAEVLDKKLSPIKFKSYNNNGTTIVKIKKPAKVDPYATVVKLTFSKTSDK
ncbi:MAG: alpha-L-fucosidase [Methanococcaceae archaeon]